MNKICASTWAELEFGSADLGDVRRTRRLVGLASAALQRPGGMVTGVVRESAEREGAFRFLENEAVSSSQISKASHQATARRAAGMPWVFVAVDQSTVSVIDHQHRKDFGKICGRGRRGGLEVMNALALDPTGVPVGLLSQQWWRRDDVKSPIYSKDKRPQQERESDLWRRAMADCCERLDNAGGTTKPWFQLDRGGDFWRVFEFVQSCGGWMTVRSCHDRCLSGSELHLWEKVKSQKVAARYSLEVPAQRRTNGTRRPRRTARMSVRFVPVTLEMKVPGRTLQVEVTAVHVRERNASKEERIEWVLLTTWPVRGVADALTVVYGYSQRWKIEEFHRAWKAGGCQVERSQLRSVDTFKRWATILAAVAARAERLKQLARKTPDIPATTELTRTEVDCAIVLSRTRKFKPKQELTLHQAITLIAEAGGYTGKSSGGPPGATTIRRGLDIVIPAAEAYEQLKKCD